MAWSPWVPSAGAPSAIHTMLQHGARTVYTGFYTFFNTFLVVSVRFECLLAKPAAGDAMR